MKPLPTISLSQRKASPDQDTEKTISNNRGNQSLTNTSTSNEAGQEVESPQHNQYSTNPNSSRTSPLQRRRAIALWNTTTGEIHNLPPFSPIRSESTIEGNVEDDNSASSPPKNPKRAKLDDAAYSTPDRSTRHSTQFSTPQKPQDNKLPTKAYTVLKNIGIPEKVIHKLEIIVRKTNSNYALCGSAALAIHMQSAGSKTDLEVGDLDIVYTGSDDSAWIARHLRSVLDTPKSTVDAAHGQILLAVIGTEEKGNFKIPKNQNSPLTIR
jgi:hypothetical protein